MHTERLPRLGFLMPQRGQARVDTASLTAYRWRRSKRTTCARWRRSRSRVAMVGLHDLLVFETVALDLLLSERDAGPLKPVAN